MTAKGEKKRTQEKYSIKLMSANEEKVGEKERCGPPTKKSQGKGEREREGSGQENKKKKLYLRRKRPCGVGK